MTYTTRKNNEVTEIVCIKHGYVAEQYANEAYAEKRCKQLNS